MNLRVGCGIDDGILIRKILVERAIDKLARCAMAFIVVPSNPCAPNREDAADYDVGNGSLTSILPFALDEIRSA